MPVKITALYCRLSQEDEKNGDSMSIQNQKMLLQNYADKNNFTNTRFFIDDGFSGVDFEKREALQQLLREVEAGRVATVITKDLSRLGRNYLRTGELIEIIFPENGVRYIAISDDVDTAREDNEFTPLKNWVNEFYARDTSKKIRAVKKAQAERGERVNGDAPYGYITAPDNKNLLLPDLETAYVVKQIFEMYIEGARICHIQDWLKGNQIATVAELQYRRKGKSRHKRPSPDAAYNWSDKTIYDILSRKEYLGHTYTNKSSKLSYKSKRTIKHSEDTQFFFPNTHEPLIDAGIFELAQKRMATRKRPTKMGEIDIFSGILFCADCGAKLYCLRGDKTPEKKHAYNCRSYRNRARHNITCTPHYIRKSVLMALVLAELRRVLVCMHDKENALVSKAIKCVNAEANKATATKRRELDSATTRIDELDKIFRRAYEDMTLDRISEQQFFAITAGYDDEKNSLASKVAKLKAKVEASKATVLKDEMSTVKKYLHIKELTYEMVHALIDKILVHDTDPETKRRKIEIFYNFTNPLFL